MATQQIIPKSAWAKNKLREHPVLEIHKRGYFRGRSSVLLFCREQGCHWRGWFTKDDVENWPIRPRG